MDSGRGLESVSFTSVAGTGSTSSGDETVVSRYGRRFPLTLAGWRMRDVLHNSDNSIIFLAENTAGVQSAIKRFKFAVARLDKGKVQRVLRQYLELCQPGCTGLVHLLDAGINDQAVYLVMEYVQGYTLKHYLAGANMPSLVLRMHWFGELLAGLGAVHEAGLLHRDLKTSNILIRENGHLVLLDFGLETCLLVESGFLGKDEIYGTPYYLSPERMMGDPSSQASDLYSLGVVLYELLTGEKPYDANSLEELLKKHALAPIPRLPEAVAAFQPLIDGLLAKFPENRLQSVETVVQMLQGIIQLCPDLQVSGTNWEVAR